MSPASAPDGGGRPAPPAPPPVSLFRTLPGRLFLVVSALLVGLLALQQVWTPPTAIDVARRLLALVWLFGAAGLALLAISRTQRAFLWRVRRKLILSYVFLGAVPVVLVLAFVLAGGVLVYVTVASYVFHEGLANAMEVATQSADTLVLELGREPASTQAAAERRYSNLAGLYPGLSLAVASLEPAAAARPYPLVAAGPWAHAAPPVRGPAWLPASGRFSGIIVVPDADGRPALVARSAAPTLDGRELVIVDLPIDAGVVERIRARTGTAIRRVSVSGCGTSTPEAPVPVTSSVLGLFRETVAFLDCTRWDDGGTGSVAVDLEAPVGGIYNRIAAASATGVSASLAGSWDVFLQILILLGVLFLVVQGSALVMGALLARSITSAVHELFEGTVRVQQGDFTHRIGIASNDQLGDLARSFDRMSESIEHLLLVQREKQRLDDELRIAREIQQSLLPVRPPQRPGLDIADLCEPAREVGGDYYDFFDLGQDRIGVLMADVSGKGTSAALYMAELKGLVLALSHTTASPRQLLIEVNRRLAAHLRERSFITMSYATIDLRARTLVLARAGHTPLIVASGGGREIVTPDGMVIGLGWPGAVARFEEVLEEHTRSFAPGDVMVLYTDGITEAMDVTGELFGDEALADIVARLQSQPAAAIRERVLREVKAFVGEAEPHDDMTMVVIRMTEAAA